MLRVEQLSLGPIGTNCYVVRSDVTADEAAIVDPSGDATELRLTLARLGTRCTGILVTHGSVITDLTGLNISMGAFAVLRRGADNHYTVVGQLFVE